MTYSRRRKSRRFLFRAVLLQCYAGPSFIRPTETPARAQAERDRAVEGRDQILDGALAAMGMTVVADAGG